MSKIKCPKCNKNTPLSTETDFIKEEKEKGTKYMTLFCEFCNDTFDYNPTDNSNPSIKSDEIVWRCPVSGCHGFVSFVEGDSSEGFYGCGETGDIWKNKNNFFNEIERIIKLYPYRKASYIKNGSEWLPNDKEPNNIDDLIDLEEEDTFKDYIRG